MHERETGLRFKLAIGATALLMACLPSCSAPVHRVVLTNEAEVASNFDLWSKAVQVAAANEGWVPGSVHTLLEVRDGDKKLETTKEIWSKLTKAPDGSPKPQVVIVKATDDGKDVTEQEQKKAKDHLDKQKKAKDEVKEIKLEFSHPFEPNRQGQVKAERTGETRTVQAKTCVGFRWQVTQTEGTIISGTAWLDQDTGVPVQIQFVLDPLPDAVKALETKVTYQTQADGSWLSKEMTIEAKGSLLFFTKYIHTHMVFSDHWKQDPTSPVAEDL